LVDLFTINLVYKSTKKKTMQSDNINQEVLRQIDDAGIELVEAHKGQTFTSNCEASTSSFKSAIPNSGVTWRNTAHYLKSLDAKVLEYNIVNGYFYFNILE
jgi:hypothetical protein